jgi:hypothetical protein
MHSSNHTTNAFSSDAIIFLTVRTSAHAKTMRIHIHTIAGLAPFNAIQMVSSALQEAAGSSLPNSQRNSWEDSWEEQESNKRSS